MNSFSDYDILQSVDWECASLFPHVLLIGLYDHCCFSPINTFTLFYLLSKTANCGSTNIWCLFQKLYGKDFGI